MDHRIPRVGLMISIVCAALATLTFIYLNQGFRGPSPTNLVTHRYELRATFADTKVLQTKFNVAVRGVIVGKVDEISYDKYAHAATVEFSVDRSKVHVFRDASALIGEFSLLGDPFVALDPGTPAAGEAPSGQLIKAEPSVNYDEAFSFLDERGRAHARRILSELTSATRVRDGGAKLNATIGAIADIVPRLRSLTDALHGQEGDLAGLMKDSSTVLGELGTREGALRSIVSAGRRTLDALASNSRSLEQGVAELPGLLDAGTRALAQTQPLLVQARPFVGELDRVTPDLAAILTRLPGFASDLVSTGSGLSKVPTLRGVLSLEARLRPLLPALEAAVENLVPVLGYAAPRANGLAAFFANFAAATQRGDAAGKWARVFFDFEPGEFNDLPTPANCGVATPTIGVCHNAYPAPNDALHNQPYRAGGFPRLMPYKPAS